MPKTMYQACDGELFHSHREAEEHEESLFREWLGTRPMIDILKLSQNSPDNTEDEYWGTPKDFVIAVARSAFESENGRV